MFASGSIESISRLHLDTASINGFVSDAIWMETARATTPALTDYCPHIFHAFHPLQTLVQTPGSTHNSHFQIFQCACEFSEVRLSVQGHSLIILAASSCVWRP